MEFPIQKEKINIKKKIGEKTKNIIIEKDIILPDNKPDIIKIQTDYSNIYVNKKEITDNRCRIDGGIETRISYLTGEGKNRVLKIEETFSENFEIQGIDNSSCIKEKIEVTSVNIKILNERKIHYKAEIQCTIIAYKKDEIEFINKIDDEHKIQMLRQKEVINQFISCSDAKISGKEKIEVDSNEEIEVIKFSYEITNIEKKISYNKILVKADCLLSILYQTESGIIRKVEKQIPLMGFIENEGITEDAEIEINFTLQNLNITENVTNIEIEIDLNMQAIVFKRVNIELLTDLYDLNHITNFEKVRIALENNENYKTYSFNKKVLIEDINQLYDMQFKVKSISKKDNNIEIEVNSEFIYSSFENQNINKKEENFKINYRTDENFENPGVEIINVNTTLLPDSNINIDFEFKIFDNTQKEIELINEINIEDDNSDDGFSMIIYFVKPGDTLWKIAKRFKSTISDIVRMNGIENENIINVGEKLYIPRAV